MFTPMTQMVMTIGGRRQRRDVPVIQDLLFVHESKPVLDPLVDKYPTLQYRYHLGKTKNEPMTVRDNDMERFIHAVSNVDTPMFYKPGELTEFFQIDLLCVVGTIDSLAVMEKVCHLDVE